MPLKLLFANLGSWRLYFLNKTNPKCAFLTLSSPSCPNLSFPATSFAFPISHHSLSSYTPAGRGYQRISHFMSSLIENAKPNFSLTQATKSRRAVKKRSQQACPNQTLAGLAERRLGHSMQERAPRST